MPVKTLLALLLMLISMPLNPDGGGDDGDDDDGGDDGEDRSKQGDPADDGDDDELGDKGKAALTRERKARETAEARAKSAEKELRDLKRAQRDADEQRDQESGNWEKLATDRATELDTANARIEELEGELRQRDVQTWRLKAAAAHNIPTDEKTLDRIQGETEADILADAEELAKLMGIDPPDDTDAGRSENRGPRRPRRNADKGTDWSNPSVWGIDT